MNKLDGMFGILAARDAHGLYEKYGFKKVGIYEERCGLKVKKISSPLKSKLYITVKIAILEQ